MAKTRKKSDYKPKPPHPPWKKGQSGNPLGGQKHDPDIKRIKNLSKQELIEISNVVIKGDTVALRKIIEDIKANKEGISVMTAWIAGVAMKGMAKGDMSALDALLNRIIGKVKDEVEVNNIGAANVPQVIVTLPSNSREIPGTVLTKKIGEE